MVDKETDIVEPSVDTSERLNFSRPFILSLLSVFSFVLFGIISLLTLLALFCSGWIAEVTEKYLPETDFSKETVILFIASGFILHSAALAGIIYIWKGRKTGYFIFSVSSILLASFQLFSDKISVLTTGTYILLIVFFGIFYRRLK